MSATTTRVMKVTKAKTAVRTPRRRYKSDVLAAIHASASALRDVGAIPATTMRTFDAACLAPVEPMSPTAIRGLRQRLRVSRPVFAQYLNTTESTLAQWESGAKRPGGLGLKLLTVVQKHGLDALL